MNIEYMLMYTINFLSTSLEDKDPFDFLGTASDIYNKYSEGEYFYFRYILIKVAEVFQVAGLIGAAVGLLISIIQYLSAHNGGEAARAKEKGLDKALMIIIIGSGTTLIGFVLDFFLSLGA